MLLAACAPQADSETPGWAPVAGISKVEIGDEVFHYADLLGDPRPVIEAGLTPEPAAADEDGDWVEYSDDLKIKYDDGVAVRMRARIPLSVRNCVEAARWMGFPLPRDPFVDGARCTWPGARVDHRLEKGYGGEFNFENRWFVAWVVDPESPQEPDRSMDQIDRIEATVARR